MANVVIGTPVFQQGDYVLNKFLKNQQKIQRAYSSCDLVFATCEPDFIASLENYLHSYNLKGTVLTYEVIKPPYARSRIWNITSGRETIRKHALSQSETNYLLFLDADMTFDPTVISVMEQKIQGYGVAFSGYPLRDHGIGLAGAGCLMLTRDILGKITFRCYEFENGEVIFEDNLLEMDLFQMRAHVNKGFFVAIDHYSSASEVKCITPQQVGPLRKIVNSPLLRYLLIRLSIMFHRNLPWKLKVLGNKFTYSLKK